MATPAHLSADRGIMGWGRGLAELIDLDRPSCVILSGVLHFLDANAAREVAAAHE